MLQNIPLKDLKFISLSEYYIKNYHTLWLSKRLIKSELQFSNVPRIPPVVRISRSLSLKSDAESSFDVPRLDVRFELCFDECNQL